MKTSRNTFCELVVALAVAGCGASSKKGSIPTSAIGEFVTLTGQIANWNGVSGPASPKFSLIAPMYKAAAGNVDAEGKFAVPLPSGVDFQALPPYAQQPLAAFCPSPSSNDMLMATVTGLSLGAPNQLDVAQLNVVLAGQHDQYVNYVYVDKELIASSMGCAIDFLPGWNSYVDDVVTMADGTVTHNEYTGPIPMGTEWVVQ